ncbi:hypothetical protein LWI29_009616 [Acer saccharum]|uniref:Uncharacterized protein n=1 Tax=Acer saccharum TaxID=4024 RepID=A0AA39VBZ9_ACESA|nr:hypothetical protein LWI29_009616 [Acer saccharum]
MVGRTDEVAGDVGGDNRRPLEEVNRRHLEEEKPRLLQQQKLTAAGDGRSPAAGDSQTETRCVGVVIRDRTSSVVLLEEWWKDRPDVLEWWSERPKRSFCFRAYSQGILALHQSFSFDHLNQSFHLLNNEHQTRRIKQ